MSTTTEQTGKNWAIESGDNTDYLRGIRAVDAKAAETEWRRVRELHFIGATARRTTPDEDARLEMGAHE